MYLFLWLSNVDHDNENARFYIKISTYRVLIRVRLLHCTFIYFFRVFRHIHVQYSRDSANGRGFFLGISDVSGWTARVDCRARHDISLPAYTSNTRVCTADREINYPAHNFGVFSLRSKTTGYTD